MIGRYDEMSARWGTPPQPVELSDQARAFLVEHVGVATPAPATGRTKVAIAPSRLSAQLREALAAVLGDTGLTLDDEARLSHGGGFSYLDLIERRGDHPITPDAVASPASHSEVMRLLRACSDLNIAVVPFGGGTSVVGGVRPLVGDHVAIVVIAFDRMAAMLAVDDINMTVTVEPGITGPTLERLLQARGLTLGHYPQSWERASIGGYVATRSAGQSSSGYGRSDEMVERLRIATPQGDFVLGRAPGSAAGPDLRQIFIGSEGALGIITEVTLRVRRVTAVSRYEGVMFPSYQAGLDAFRELVARRCQPTLMRLSDPEETLTNLTMAVEGKKAMALNTYLRARRVMRGSLAIFAWEGSRTQVGSHHHESWRVLRGCGAVSLGQGVGRSWEHSRFAGPYMRDTLLDAGYLVETLETATGWRELPALRETVRATLTGALADGGAGPLVMSHLSHVYETGGSLYVTVVARRDHEDSVGQWQRTKTAACDALVGAGATITHHHAVGRDHAPWLAAEIGPNGVDLLRAIKTHLDPAQIMNPGVLLN